MRAKKRNQRIPSPWPWPDQTDLRMTAILLRSETYETGIEQKGTKLMKKELKRAICLLIPHRTN